MLVSIILATCAQSLNEIESTLIASVDKSTYENGAYSAARTLADNRSADAMRLRIKLFDTKYTTYRGVYLRDWFYTGYTKSNTRQEGDLMLVAAASKKQSAWHRILLLRGIELSKVQVSGDLLLNKNFLKDDDICRAWQQCAGVLLKESRIDFSDVKASRGQSAKDKLLDLFNKAGAPYYGYAYLDQLSPAQLQQLVRTATEAKDPSDRAIAIRVLLQQDPSNTNILPIALSTFNDQDSGPRTAVLDSMIENEIFSAVPTLISLLKAEVAAFPDLPNRYIPDIGNALRKLTGITFGDSPEMWRDWWQKGGKEWLATVKKGSVKTEAASQKDAHTVSKFFGIPVNSNNVAILVDGSGSMSSSYLRGETCAAAAAIEVDNFLKSQPKKVMFNVAAIEPTIEFGFKKMMANSSKNRAKALKFLKSRSYRSTSALFDALEAAALNPGIDTVLLVSDGGSSAGKHQYPGHTLEAYKRLYLRTGLRVHSVLVTDSNKHAGFLSNLSAISGGRMVQPK
ncbi:MAG: hypothetical protein H8E25_12115 [Planctomycetes bacterium]|nr:hypothetical protein [Planctomycetota bacterium]